ncbi:hypothetical protein [Verrucosispora sioxanthis]|uniref:hypothetical protein n=1 Tax=Verrucosispora sioxanthis TaxID=2499994 RepID=UPI004039041D
MRTSSRRWPPDAVAALLDSGTDLVFLSAGSEEIARVYVRVGFRRIGTACIASPTPLHP